jgi:hypothetical protein
MTESSARKEMCLLFVMAFGTNLGVSVRNRGIIELSHLEKSAAAQGRLTKRQLQSLISSRLVAWFTWKTTRERQWSWGLHKQHESG